MQWVFLKSCGCPFGVLEGSYAKDEFDAWHEFYEGRSRDLRKARLRGVRLEHVSHAEYVQRFFEHMRSGVCTHGGAS